MGISATWAGLVSSVTETSHSSDPPFYSWHLRGQQGQKGSWGLTSSSSLKIREKIKMKSTAEDLVIVYLEAKSTTMHRWSLGLRPAIEKGAHGTISGREKWGSSLTSRRATGSAQGSRAIWVQKTKRRWPASSGLVCDL